MSIIQPGATIAVRVNTFPVNYFFVNLTDATRISVRGQRCSLRNSIGHAFGSTFEVSDGNLTFVASFHDHTSPCAQQNTDNRNLVVDECSQKLSAEEIVRLKQDDSNPVSRKRLVELLAENSTTFHMKTSFSKEKYIARKLVKHAPTVTILTVTPLVLLQSLSCKSREKVLSLRSDSLALLLHSAGFQSCRGAHTLIYDRSDSSIVLIAAVWRGASGPGRITRLLPRTAANDSAEPLGNFGGIKRPRIVEEGNGSTSPVNYRNVPSVESILRTSACKLRKSDLPTSLAADCGISSAMKRVGLVLLDGVQVRAAAAAASFDSGDSTHTPEGSELPAVFSFNQQLFTSAVVAVPASTDVVLLLRDIILPRLSPSCGGSFAVYCPSVTPLLVACGALRGNTLVHSSARIPSFTGQLFANSLNPTDMVRVISLDIVGSFCRDIIIGPGGSHPATHSTTTGFVLRGIIAWEHCVDLRTRETVPQLLAPPVDNCGVNLSK